MTWIYAKDIKDQVFENIEKRYPKKTTKDTDYIVPTSMAVVVWGL